MSLKRLAISFCAVVALVFAAAVVQVLILVFPAQPPVADSDEAALSAPAPQSPLARDEESLFEEVLQAIRLVPDGAIVADGAPLTPELAAAIADNEVNFGVNVEYLEQEEHLASGCEIMALCVTLQAEGYDADPNEMAQEHLRMGGDVANDYIGEPWTDGGGYPPVIVDAANDWLAEHGEGARAHNLTGSTFDGLLDIVACGYPVVTWTTEDMSEPRFEGDPDDENSWYFPEHCVVVYGVDGDEVLVSDSLEGLVRHDLREFADIYEACGSRALFIVKM